MAVFIDFSSRPVRHGPSDPSAPDPAPATPRRPRPARRPSDTKPDARAEHSDAKPWTPRRSSHRARRPPAGTWRASFTIDITWRRARALVDSLTAAAAAALANQRLSISNHAVLVLDQPATATRESRTRCAKKTDPRRPTEPVTVDLCSKWHASP